MRAKATDRPFGRGWLIGLWFWAMSSPAEPPSLPDAKLSKCVAAAMAKEQARAPGELRSLTCNAKGIVDATGLGQFTGLTTLSLFGNRIATIDLLNLPNLESLNLANNALRVIDLSGKPALRVLYLFGNRLEALNLGEAPQLSKLKAEKNRLVSVSFGSSSALKKVYLFENEMVDIKIDNLTELQFIDVRSNPMPDEVYDYLDEFAGVKASHDGNTEDWK